MDKSWLLDHRIIPQINHCRRLIQAEFGVRLHLTDENLTQRLAEFTARSRSGKLQTLWQELTAAIPEAMPHKEPVRLYRGQPIAEDVPTRSPEAPTGPPHKKQVIYRGRRIEA